MVVLRASALIECVCGVSTLSRPFFSAVRYGRSPSMASRSVDRFELPFAPRFQGDLTSAGPGAEARGVK